MNRVATGIIESFFSLPTITNLNFIFAHSAFVIQVLATFLFLFCWMNGEFLSHISFCFIFSLFTAKLVYSRLKAFRCFTRVSPLCERKQKNEIEYFVQNRCKQTTTTQIDASSAQNFRLLFSFDLFLFLWNAMRTKFEWKLCSYQQVFFKIHSNPIVVKRFSAKRN